MLKSEKGWMDKMQTLFSQGWGCMYVYIYAHVHIYVEAIGIAFLGVIHLSKDRISHLAWNSLIRLNLWASQSQGSAHLCLPGTDIVPNSPHFEHSFKVKDRADLW